MIISLDQVSEFPLCWPDDKPRAAERRRSQFQTTIAKAHREIVRDPALAAKLNAAMRAAREEQKNG